MNELFNLLIPVNSDGVVSKRAATDVNVSLLPTYIYDGIITINYQPTIIII